MTKEQLEIIGRMSCLEQQRNQALADCAIKHGQLLVATERIKELEAQVAENDKQIEKLSTKSKRKNGEAHAQQ